MANICVVGKSFRFAKTQKWLKKKINKKKSAMIYTWIRSRFSITNLFRSRYLFYCWTTAVYQLPLFRFLHFFVLMLEIENKKMMKWNLKPAIGKIVTDMMFWKVKIISVKFQQIEKKIVLLYFYTIWNKIKTQIKSKKNHAQKIYNKMLTVFFAM